MVKPAAIHITSAPHSRNENVLKMNRNSPLDNSLMCHLRDRRPRAGTMGSANDTGRVVRPGSTIACARSCRVPGGRRVTLDATSW